MIYISKLMSNIMKILRNRLRSNKTKKILFFNWWCWIKINSIALFQKTRFKTSTIVWVSRNNLGLQWAEWIIQINTLIILIHLSWPYSWSICIRLNLQISITSERIVQIKISYIYWYFQEPWLFLVLLIIHIYS